MSNGCAPVLASYSAITLFTSSMSAVAGSYSRSVVSPWDENVRILDFMFGLLWDVPFRFPVGKQSAGLVPEGHIALFSTVVKMASRLPSPSIWALSQSIHATTSFDAAVAVPGEIYSRAMNSLPHRN